MASRLGEHKALGHAVRAGASEVGVDLYRYPSAAFRRCVRLPRRLALVP